MKSMTAPALRCALLLGGEALSSHDAAPATASRLVLQGFHMVAPHAQRPKRADTVRLRPLATLMAWLPAPTPSARAPPSGPLSRQGAARPPRWPMAGVFAAASTARGALSSRRPRVCLKSRLEKRVLRDSPFPKEKPYEGDLVRQLGGMLK